MSDDLSILPPDADVFHKNKPTSDKQKSHLVKAREKARETIERRKMLDQQLKEQEKKKKEKEDLEPVQEEDDEEDDEVEIVRKIKPKKQSKKVVLTEEEEDARRFQKFMKNMKMYEAEKEESVTANCVGLPRKARRVAAVAQGMSHTRA